MHGDNDTIGIPYPTDHVGDKRLVYKNNKEGSVELLYNAVYNQYGQILNMDIDNLQAQRNLLEIMMKMKPDDADDSWTPMGGYEYPKQNTFNQIELTVQTEQTVEDFKNVMIMKLVSYILLMKMNTIK